MPEFETSDHAYLLEDFAPNGSANGTATSGPASHDAPPKPSGLVLREDAEPPAGKFAALIAFEKKFRTTWERTRTDVADTSPSGWDMALANGAVEAGWTNQEIVNLLIANRREHGDELKLREDYFAATIQKARVMQGDYTALMEAALDDDDQTRSARLRFLSEHFGAEITAFVRHPGPPDSYVLQTAQGNMTIKSTETLLSAGKMRALWLQHSGRVLPPFKVALWTSVVQALADIQQDDILAEATEAGRVESWIDGYLDANPSYDNMETAAPYRDPFYEPRRNNRLCLFLSSFHSWLLMYAHEAISTRELAALLRKQSWEPATLRVQIKGRHTTRSVWVTPYDRNRGDVGGDDPGETLPI